MFGHLPFGGTAEICPQRWSTINNVPARGETFAPLNHISGLRSASLPSQADVAVIMMGLKKEKTLIIKDIKKLKARLVNKGI